MRDDMTPTPKPESGREQIENFEIELPLKLRAEFREIRQHYARQQAVIDDLKVGLRVIRERAMNIGAITVVEMVDTTLEHAKPRP